MYDIELTSVAEKFYSKSDKKTTQRLNRYIDGLAANPYKGTNIRKLTGKFKGSYRLRVGNMRIIYSIDEAQNIIYIEVIGFRGNVY